jgi:predicted phage terminase large subunit-like protein
MRMRSASNPGGIGRLWVKQRFIEGAIGEHDRSVIFMKEGRCYIPSRITDNPHLSGEEYRQTLEHLPPVEREQLMNGDWDVQAEGLFHEEWFRYYIETSGQLELQHADGSLLAVVPEGSCYRFLTVDPAGTSAEKARARRGYAPSWSVIQVWDQPRRELAKNLILRDQVRKQVDFNDLCKLIQTTFKEWKAKKVWIEGEHLGMATVSHLKKEGMPIEPIGTGGRDKRTRAGQLNIKLSNGEVFLPKYESRWRPGFEAELLAWTGDERQEADQIDAAAYAAIVAAESEGGVIRLTR